jgi:hypothetical protein
LILVSLSLMRPIFKYLPSQKPNLPHVYHRYL